MRKLLIGAAVAAFGLGGGQALAADAGGPVYKSPVMAPMLMYNWTGFYIGAHAGWGWADKDWTQTFSSFGIPLDRNGSSAAVDGFLAGAQLGFNWQTGPWVFGVEGQWSWTDADGCSAHVVFPLYSGCSKVDWYATVAARFGYAWNNVLLYGKGGVAFADESHVITFNFPPPTVITNEPSSTRTGWMVGVGLEYGFWQNWSAKVEYNYMDFGSESFSFTYTAAPPGLVETWDIDQRVHVVKFGINYRFSGWLR